MNRFVLFFPFTGVNKELLYSNNNIIGVIVLTKMLLYVTLNMMLIILTCLVCVMEVYYLIFSSKVLIEGNYFDTYGIHCIVNNKIIETFNDISLNRDEVLLLCKCLNMYHISPVHFYDIIEDYLNN